jgi:hypothetical protein
VARVQYQLKKSLSLAFRAGKKNYFIEGDIFLYVDSILPGDRLPTDSFKDLGRFY